MNRYFRRVEQFGKNFYEQRNRGTMVDKKRAHAPQDVADPREERAPRQGDRRQVEPMT